MAVTTSAQKIIGSARYGNVANLPEQYWELVERYRAELLNQAMAITGNITDAEDIVQETLCEAVRHSQKLALARSLGAWLRSINRTNALDHVRKGRSQNDRKSQRQKAGARDFTTGGFGALELQESIARAIETLSGNLRTVVVLHYWEHLTCEQIAERLSMPTGTVKWLLAEAAVRLHKQLKSVIAARTGAHKPTAERGDNA